MVLGERINLPGLLNFWGFHSVHTNSVQVILTCVGVLSEADNTEVRTENLTVTFKRVGEGLL